MSKIVRYVYKPVSVDLRQKMVFISGPRQVGKTTFSFSFIKNMKPGHPAYLSWDNIHDRDKIKSAELPAKQPLVVFDEIHKFARWRGLVKGLYDKYGGQTRFLVTGSARLDYFSKGGIPFSVGIIITACIPFRLTNFHTRRQGMLCCNC